MALIEDFGDPTTVILLVALVFLVGLLFFFFFKKTKPSKGSATHKAGDDQEKIAMAKRIHDLENANKDLRDRLRNLEMEYLERQDLIKNSEVDIGIKTKELDDGLKEVYALKETIEEHRLRIVKLGKEKEELSAKVGELSAKVKEGKKRFDEEFAAEMKRLEDDKEDIKRKAKEMVVSYKKEVEEKIQSLEDENKSLKEKILKMKEQYSAWEAIDGL